MKTLDITQDPCWARIVTKVCRLIDEAVEPLSLTQLAESVELSPQYFHRLFSQVAGLTPKAYATAGGAARLREDWRRPRRLPRVRRHFMTQASARTAASTRRRPASSA